MTCVHCEGPIGDEHRAVKGWFARKWLRGRACRDCWDRRLRGSLLYRADLCHTDPCACGWCADARAGKEAP